MSQPNSTALPTDDQAFDHLYTNLSQRVFFNKLAAAGFAPTTPDEAAALLEMGAQLDVMAEHGGVKQAADGGDSAILQARAALDQYCGAARITPVWQKQAAAEEAASRRRVAVELAQDPTFYNAVLVLKAAEAAEQLGYRG